MSDGSHSPTHNDLYDDSIDLAELIRTLWSGKWLIIGCALAASIIAIVLAVRMPNVYRAEALLAPNDRDGASGLSAMAAQYSGIASLAGISIGAGSTDKIALGLEVLKSRKFIAEFVERRDILVPLMAARDWDSGSGELTVDSDIYDVDSKTWVRNVSAPRTPQPSLQEAYQEFRNILSVSRDKKSGFVRIAIDFYDPETARQWVDWLVADLNSAIMRDDVAEAEQAIRYLNKQIENTSVADLQNVFFNLIEEQTKTTMLAQVSDEYLLKTIDPAIAPELKIKPRRSLIVIIGGLLGSLAGVVLVLVLSAHRGR